METLLSRQRDEQEESHWLSVSDLMAGLMMVFLFIAVALMQSAVSERDAMADIAKTYRDTQMAIYEALMDEFADELKRWNADIDQETLTFTFKSPEVLFDEGKSALKVEYKNLLADFFPRYLEVLQPYRETISEIRIEGHTNSQWNTYVSDDEAYFKNMELSQGRTRAVLEYLFEIPKSLQYLSWMKSNVAAVGLSSSKLIYNKQGIEDTESSRRVSFRIITNADEQIGKILNKKP
jgi:outer membrane protein OmpA-like peptidoglycan-associated protein